MSFVRRRLEGDTSVPTVPALPPDPDAVVPPAPVPVPAVEPAPVPVPEPAPVVPVEKRYEYQPRDEQGHPIGGRQVIIYTDEEDLKKKWTAKEEQLVRKLREVTRKQKLGINDEESLPEDTEFATFDEPKPRVLTAEERFQLSQDINDPEKSVDAMTTLLEATVGFTAEQMRKQFSETQFAKLQHQALVNFQVFIQQNTEFYQCPENAKMLTDWMFSKKLSPTVKNYNLAFSSLNGAGLLQQAPTVREVPPAPAPSVIVPPAPAPASTEPQPVVPAENDGRITTNEPPQQKRQPVRLPSGLNNNVASDSGPISVGTKLTIAEFDKMSADEVKKKLKDPVFAKMVNDLYAKKPA